LNFYPVFDKLLAYMAVETDEIYQLFEQIRPHIVEKGKLHDEGYILHVEDKIAGQMSTHADIIIIEETASHSGIDAEAVGLWPDGTIHNSITPQFRKEAQETYEGNWQQKVERPDDLLLPRAKPSEFGLNRRRGTINLLRRTLATLQTEPASAKPHL
jgi:hypothetical protein